jgi:hypothetical protein
MIRYYEYTDADGKRWGAVQNTPDASRTVMNQHLGHLAHKSGWRDVEAFPPNMPDHIIKGRVNAIQATNGNPLLHEEHETREPTAKPKSIVILDHAEGEQQAMETFIAQPKGVVALSNGGIVGAPPAAAIVDHADTPTLANPG